MRYDTPALAPDLLQVKKQMAVYRLKQGKHTYDGYCRFLAEEKAKGKEVLPVLLALALICPDDKPPPLHAAPILQRNCESTDDNRRANSNVHCQSSRSLV